MLSFFLLGLQVGYKTLCLLSQKEYSIYFISLNLLHFLFVLKDIIVLHSSRIMRNDILDLAYIKLTNVHISMK